MKKYMRLSLVVLFLTAAACGQAKSSGTTVKAGSATMGDPNQNSAQPVAPPGMGTATLSPAAPVSTANNAGSAAPTIQAKTKQPQGQGGPGNSQPAQPQPPTQPQASSQNSPVPGSGAVPTADPAPAKNSAAANPNFMDSATAAPKIKAAEDILNKDKSADGSSDPSTGQQTVQYLNGANSYATEKPAPIDIYIMKSASTLSAIGQVTGATIMGHTDSGTPYVVASPDLSPSDFAQVLAHEVELIMDDWDENNSPDLPDNYKATLHSALAKLKDQRQNGQSGQNALSADESKAAEFHADGIFCSQVRAFGVNADLQKDGIPYSLDFGGKSVPQFVVDNFITPRSLPFKGDPSDLSGKCLDENTYDTIVDFQNAMVFPPAAPPANQPVNSPAQPTNPPAQAVNPPPANQPNQPAAHPSGQPPSTSSLPQASQVSPNVPGVTPAKVPAK